MHTPLPWHLGHNCDNAVFAANGRCVALCDTAITPNIQAGNAALIVRAANAHALLVATLHDALEYFEANADVRDGPEGRPLPDRCMQLAQELREVLDRV